MIARSCPQQVRGLLGLGVLLPPVGTAARHYVFAQAAQYAVLATVVPALVALGAPWRLGGQISAKLGGREPTRLSGRESARLSGQQRAKLSSQEVSARFCLACTATEPVNPI